MAAKIFLNLPNGVKMPALGLGTFLAKDPVELETALKAALDLGYRHIDTATLYGNEAVIGKVLKEAIDSGKIKREEFFITTKLPPSGLASPDQVEPHLKESLKKLQLDYVDLYLIHGPVGFKITPPTSGGAPTFELLPKTDHIGIWKSMEKQVKDGRTKSIGLSNYNISQIQNILDNAEIKPANLQVEVQIHFQQKELLAFCKKNNITVVAYGPLGNPAHNQRSKEKSEIDLPDVLDHPTVKEIAQKYSKTPAQVLLRFLLQLGVAPIPKSVTPKRLKENINVFDYQLAEVDFNKLKAADVGEKGRLVTMKALPGIENHPDYPFFKN